MARRPARLERAGALTPRDQIWSAIRALGRHATATGALFSPCEVAALAQQHPDTVLTYMRGLCAAGHLELHERDRPEGRSRREFAQYRLVRDTGVDAPRVTEDGKPVTAGQANERMWTAIKVLRDFDSLELAQAASVPGCAITGKTAQSYVRFLARAGYLVRVAEAMRGGYSREGVKARYRFVRAKNTGPRAPLITRGKCVMDGNTGAIVHDPAQALA